jgi:hypothetical protein
VREDIVCGKQRLYDTTKIVTIETTKDENIKSNIDGREVFPNPPSHIY